MTPKGVCIRLLSVLIGLLTIVMNFLSFASNNLCKRYKESDDYWGCVDATKWASTALADVVVLIMASIGALSKTRYMRKYRSDLRNRLEHVELANVEERRKRDEMFTGAMATARAIAETRHTAPPVSIERIRSRPRLMEIMGYDDVSYSNVPTLPKHAAPTAPDLPPNYMDHDVAGHEYEEPREDLYR